VISHLYNRPGRRTQGYRSLSTGLWTLDSRLEGVRRWRLRHGVLTVLAALGGSLLLLFLAAPLVELIATGGVAGVAGLARDAELRRALGLTVITATLATLVGVTGGTPIAYVLSRFEFRGRALVAAVLDLPLLIPHPVAGIALLLVLGRESAVGQLALSFGMRIVGSPVGIVCAMLFVSVPLYISGAREAFSRVDRRYEAVARTLGDDSWRAFRRVTLPLASRGMTAAAVVMWARAVSEFGAIVILTYNPKTVSVLSYDRFTSFGLSEALPVAAVLAIFALLPLTVLRALRYERAASAIL
jgi:molybdate/tungstate transport system permease protein